MNIERGSAITDQEKSDAIDKVVETLGFGRWTLFMMAPYICYALVLPFFSLGGAFLNPNVDHWCTEKNISQFTDLQLPSFLNSTTIWEEVDGELVRSRCQEYDVERWNQDRIEIRSNQKSGFVNLNFTEESFPRKKCNKWDFDTSTFSSTVSMEWGLVCDSAGISPFFQSFYFFGVTVGEPLLGYLSDKFGRRWILRRIWFLFIVAAVTSVTSPNYLLLLAMRFLLGIVHAASSVAYVLVLETCPCKYRSQVGLCCTAVYAITGVVFGGLAYFIRDWRYLQAVCIIPGLLHLLYLPFMDESPRWLLHNLRLEEGIKTLKKAARWQKINLNLPSGFALQEVPACKIDSLPPATPKGCYTSSAAVLKSWLKDLLTLVSTPAIRGISLAMFGCWFVAGLSYWGMSLAGSTFSNDPFLYMILQSLMEIVGYTWIIPILRFFGRKTVLSFNFFGCATCMFVILVLSKDLIWVSFTLALIGKLFITAAYNLLYLYSVELFPTCVRNRGLNMSSMMARIASISSPFVVTLLASSYTWAPSVVFGSAAAFGTLLAFMLPESRGRPLLDSVEQVEEIYGKKPRQNRDSS